MSNRIIFSRRHKPLKVGRKAYQESVSSVNLFSMFSRLSVKAREQTFTL
jgi:hypothetical protein